MDAPVRKHGRRYPWASWLSGRHAVLVRGRDYDCRTATMVQLAHRAAARLGIAAHVYPAEDERSIILIVNGVRA